jgi:ribosomal protein L36
MEINIERQFFEVGPFMSAVQQNLPDALTKRLPREVALNSAPMAIKIRPSQAEQIARMCDYVSKSVLVYVICSLVLLVTKGRLRLGLS